MGLDPKSPHVKLHESPASNHQILDNDPDGEECLQAWNHQSVVGVLELYPSHDLSGSTCGCAAMHPKHAYEEVVKCICHYLLKTKDQEWVLKPDATKGLECYFDAGWLGLGRSIHLMILSPPIQGQGILLCMPAAPSFGGSKLQKLIALSTTEAEYIALSSALQEGGYSLWPTIRAQD